MREMTETSRIPNPLLRVALLVLVALLFSSGSVLAEQQTGTLSYRDLDFAGGSVARIYPPDYVRQEFVVFEQGSARLEFPGYDSVELMLPDSEGGKCGYDVFHPHALGDVIEALESVSYPRPVAELEIVILPYPRTNITSSSAIGNIVFLSPGIRTVPAEVTHMVTTHELGHVFHNENMSDEEGKHWQEYRRIRGIEDETVYCQSSSHDDRPHEIFAEDFRYLFGGALAKYSDSIENADLPTPDQVFGLYEFFLAVTTEQTLVPALAETRLEASNHPNPFNPSTRITVSAEAADLGSPLSVEIFDAQGRHVRSLHRGELTRDQMQFEWNGRDDRGHELPSGVYFTRVLVGQMQITHKMILVG